MNLIGNTKEEIIAIELQKKQLELLGELDRVCRQLDVSYCLAYGTAIGAVRHHGFIPWDDDIDVYMDVEDLEKLQHNAHLFGDGFFLQHPKTDPEYGLIITRLRNSNTTLIEETEINRDINHGIFVDIYPLFNVPKNKFKADLFNMYAMVYRLMLYGVAPKNHGGMIKNVSQVLLKAIPRKLSSHFMKICYKTIREEKETGLISTYIWGEHNKSVPRDYIFPTQKAMFENMEVPIANDYDRYLTAIYGDYMELPPVEKRAFHHNYVCVDVDLPYTAYKGELY